MRASQRGQEGRAHRVKPWIDGSVETVHLSARSGAVHREAWCAGAHTQRRGAEALCIEAWCAGARCTEAWCGGAVHMEAWCTEAQYTEALECYTF